MILLVLLEPAPVGVDLGRVEQRRQVDALRLPVLHGLARLELVDAADHFLERAETELRHDLAQFLRDELHEIDDVLGLALELLAQSRILRRDARRAGVQVADTHHDAARRHQRRGGEAELLGAEQRRDRDVASRLQLTVGLRQRCGCAGC